MPPARIHDSAAIGDGHSVALVARSGSIDWPLGSMFAATERHQRRTRRPVGTAVRA